MTYNNTNNIHTQLHSCFHTCHTVKSIIVSNYLVALLILRENIFMKSTYALLAITQWSIAKKCPANNVYDFLFLENNLHEKKEKDR